MPRRVLLDANVLYSARLRDLWMELGVSALIDLVWTERIEHEWMPAVLRSRPESEQHLRRTADHAAGLAKHAYCRRPGTGGRLRLARSERPPCRRRSDRRPCGRDRNFQHQRFSARFPVIVQYSNCDCRRRIA